MRRDQRQPRCLSQIRPRSRDGDQAVAHNTELIDYAVCPDRLLGGPCERSGLRKIRKEEVRAAQAWIPESCALSSRSGRASRSLSEIIVTSVGQGMARVGSSYAIVRSSDGSWTLSIRYAVSAVPLNTWKP